jgi:D-alanine-D-alanine ligase
MNAHRILLLHSDVAPDAPPDEQDTLYQVESIAEVLSQRGHRVSQAPFIADEGKLGTMIAGHEPDVVFNLVEAIDGSGFQAIRVPAMLERAGVRYTGAGNDELVAAGNKPLTKRLLRDAGLPTPDWAVAPHWTGVSEGQRLIVKSTLEDCSLGLTDESVVMGIAAAKKRAQFCARKFGGEWFAEAYIEGREFNVAVLGGAAGPTVLPLAEMTFLEWQAGRPRIVGYDAKWEDESFESTRTVRAFGIDEAEPELAREIRRLCLKTWDVLSLTSYARVDIRVGLDGKPTILEINPNPCLSPDAGFAAAAERVGMDYGDLIERIVAAALA